jgi:Tol biopolymer transport system component
MRNWRHQSRCRRIGSRGLHHPSRRSGGKLTAKTGSRDLSPGRRLGPYEILGQLGAGGMGEVLRARDTRLGRDVALKVLPAAFADDPERLARFRREAQLLAALNDPHIAAIYGLEETDGIVALALELAQGEDLAGRLKRGPLAVEEALGIALQVAEGLEAAHETGIVHRDLKPANVMLSPDGKVKLLDFGLAKAWDAEAGTGSTSDLSQSPTRTHGTEAGIILGTAAYMSPEQARGKRVDKRADVWAFGVVVWEMLTGLRLFAGETTSDTLAAVLRQDVDWTRLPKELDPDHRRLLERCLERDPRKRLRDIGEARLALEAVPRPVGSFAISRPRSSALALALCAAVAFAAGFGVATRVARPAPVGVGTGIKVLPVTSSGNVTTAAISPDGRYLAYVESEHGQQSLWLKQLAGGQTLRLVDDQPTGYWGVVFTPDGTGLVFGRKSAGDLDGTLYSISTLGGAPRVLLRDMDSAVTFSPDGRRFAYTRLRHPSPDETSVMVASADGKESTVLARFKYPEFVAGVFHGAPAWSPDGRTIAIAVNRLGTGGVERGARMVQISVADGSVSPLADAGWESAAQAAWMPDGRSLLAVARAPDQFVPQIWSVSVPGGEARAVTSSLDDYRIVSLSHDGRRLVSVAGHIAASVWVSPMQGGKATRIGRANIDGLEGVAFAPDGRIVYTSVVDGGWSVWGAGPDGADRGPLLTLGPAESATSPSVSDAGEVFYVVRSRSGNEVRSTHDGTSTRMVARDVAFDRIAVTPDGKTLVHVALVGGETYVFRAPVAGGERIRLYDRPAFGPSLDPSGRRVSFFYVDEGNRFRVGVVSIEGGPILESVGVVPPTTVGRQVLGKDGVYLNNMPEDRGNVWLQPLDGSPARRVTAYDDQHVLFDLAVSPAGRHLAVVRGPRTRDAQLITGFGGTF